MRHLLSLVLGLILAPLIYILTGVANVKFFEYYVRSDKTDFVALAVCVVCALAAGGLYTVLVLARLSPVGPVLAGLILFVSGILMLFTNSLADALPSTFLGVPDALQDVGGTLFLIAPVPLLCTVLSPRRWRSSAQPATSTGYLAPVYGTVTTPPVYQPAATSYSGSPAYQAATPTYTPPSYSAPPYSSPADTTIQSPAVD
jgi:hypothetical protein